MKMITSTQIGHRYIPSVDQTFDCLTCPKGPVPDINIEEIGIIQDETYKTMLRSSYVDLKTLIRSYDANRKCPKFFNTHYMCSAEDSLSKTPIGPPRRLLSTCHASYKSVANYPSLALEDCLCFRETSWPNQNQEFCLPPGPKGKTKFLDPYFTPNRLDYQTHVPYDPGTTTTFYTEAQELKKRKPPDPSKNMCLGKGRPNVKISYDRVIKKAPLPLLTSLTSTQRSHYVPPISLSQRTTRRLMDVGIRWNDSTYLPFKCKLY